MENGSNIKRYSAAEARERRARGESRSDLARVRAKSEEELERDISSDDEWKDVPPDWHKHVEAVVPAGKKLVSLRIDNDVLDWFRGQGSGYQTRINAVLRAFMQQSGKRRTG